MLNFMTIDDEWINLAHVVKAEFSPAREAGQSFYDEDANEMRTPPARQARLVLTLSSVHLSTESEGERGDLAAASVSDKMTVHGEHAETAWLVLSGQIEAIE